MKLYELAKDLNLKSADVLKKANDLGLEIKTIMNVITDAQVEIIRKELAGIVPVLVVPEHKKGVLLGAIFDGKKFVSVKLRITKDQLDKLDSEVLAEHDSIYGAIIELNKKMRVHINENTVKPFKEGL